MSELEEQLKYDREKVRNSVRLQMPLEMTSYTLPRNMEAYIRGVMEMFLEECHQEHLKEYLNFCIGELLTNSKKANTKRVYFKEKNLDIDDPEDYEKGMEHFKEDTLTNIDHYLELQKKAGLYIKLSLKILADKIYIEISNNVKLTVFERERIQQKLDSVQQYGEMDEVLTKVLDQTEGAGLGIIIIILMLQKVGLSKENYQVLSTDEETITRIIMPCNRTVFAGVEMMSYEFVNFKDTIPIRKDNCNKVYDLLKKPSVNRCALYEIIRSDPTLTLLLLKYAREKDSTCFNFTKAMSMLTDNDLKYIFSDSNPNCEFIDPTEKMKDIWEHSRRVAFYAYNLFKNSPYTDITDGEEVLYLLGLLNSLGAIFLATASHEQLEYITELSRQYDDYGDNILDMFRYGNAATFLTMVVAKRFGFERDTCNKLVSWNGLALVPDFSISEVSILHLAESLQYYDEGMIDYYQIDKNVRKAFNLSNESQFKALLANLKNGLETLSTSA